VKGDLEPVVTDEEEVVRALWYLGKVGVTDLRDVETKDVAEDFWRYACDFQQRVSGPFESDNFCIRAGDLNALRQVSHTLLERINSRRFLCPLFLRATGCSSQCGRKS